VWKRGIPFEWLARRATIGDGMTENPPTLLSRSCGLTPPSPIIRMRRPGILDAIHQLALACHVPAGLGSGMTQAERASRCHRKISLLHKIERQEMTPTATMERRSGKRGIGEVTRQRCGVDILVMIVSRR